MFSSRSPGKLRIVLLVSFSVCGYGQKPAPYQLVTKTAVPAFRNVDVLYSPDERFAVISGDETVYVYNLPNVQEVFRTRVPGLFLSSRLGFLAFDQTSTHLYLKNVFDLQDCTISSLRTQCATIRKDVGSGLSVDGSGRIAYVNVNGVPTVIDSKAPSKVKHFEPTLPPADMVGFNWTTVEMDAAPGLSTRLVLTGKIERESKVPGDRGRTKIASHDEWHVSVFDVIAIKTLVSYKVIPVDVDSTMLSSDGRVILCGPESNREGSAAATRFFDLDAFRYLGSTEQNRLPRSFRNRCLELPVPAAAFGMFLPPTQPGTTSLNPLRGWKSPKGDLEINTGTAANGSQAIYLKHLTAPFTTDVLAGSTEPLDGVSFLPPASIVARGLNSTHVFDFLADTTYSVGIDVRYAPGKRNAVFFPDPDTKLWKLAFIMPDSKIAASSLSLKKRPSWFGLSGDGSAVAYDTNSGLFVYRDSGTTRLECSAPLGSSLFSSSNRHAIVDPMGLSLGAFCSRDASDPTSGGVDTFFVVWNLQTGKERGRIWADGFDQTGAIGWDGRKILVGGLKGLRLGDTDHDRVSEIHPAKLDELKGSIQSIRLTEDGTKAAVAVNGLLKSRRGTLLWLELPTGKIVDEISSPETITEMALSSRGVAAVLRSNNIVSVYAQSRNRIAQLIAAGTDGWLAFSEEGMFDGSASALDWAGFRQFPDGPLTTAKSFFNELYMPGLLPLIARGTAPHLPAGIGLSTYLEVPGLKLLLQNGDLVPRLIFGEASLCVNREELFTTLQASHVKAEKPTDSDCPRRIILRDQSAPASLVSDMRALAAMRPNTPWDGLKMMGANGTVHMLNVAVSQYSQSNQPDVPTAVPSSRALKQALTVRGAGDNARDWTEGCGPMENAAATKPAIVACLEKMAGAVKPSDMVVISLAGHGGAPGQTELFYYYPHSTGQDQEGISSAELGDAIRKLAARRIVLIVDACEGGAAFEPLQQAVLARAALAANLPRQQDAPGATAVPDIQGVLLIAAASGVEPTTSSEKVNPFLDKLTRLLSSGELPLTSYAIAAEMRKALSFTNSSGETIRVQPFTSALGADFQITKGRNP